MRRQCYKWACHLIFSVESHDGLTILVLLAFFKFMKMGWIFFCLALFQCSRDITFLCGACVRFLVDEVGASSALRLPLNIVVLEIYLIFLQLECKNVK